MGKKLLIVHGYSDSSESFVNLKNFFVENRAYAEGDIYFVDYTSMDDQTTYFDLADKLDSDYQRLAGGERIDVACHSTGSLVVRAWLALHNERSLLRRPDDLPSCPIKRLLCFAPANFGSDLAVLGQSVLSKFRTTFFNKHAKKRDAFETGKVLLQGLEPASPFQWMLSNRDLHGEHTYFSPKQPPSRQCFPFVFAAGESYGGMQAKLIKQRGMPGTDGTVRIPGTSLNTRKCIIDFADDKKPELEWYDETKFADIPFAVFQGLNHGSIVDGSSETFRDAWGPGPLAILATKVETTEQYNALAKSFRTASEKNYQRAKTEASGVYQQFFFKVRDDVDIPVADYYIDFHVVDAENRVIDELTLKFDEVLDASFCRHSVDASHRCLMLECTKLGEFKDDLDRHGARLMLQVDGVSGLPDVTYRRQTLEVFDPKKAYKTAFLCPNTTTLVDIVLNRQQSEGMVVLRNSTLDAILTPPLKDDDKPKGRAEIAAR